MLCGIFSYAIIIENAQLKINKHITYIAQSGGRPRRAPSTRGLAYCTRDRSAIALLSDQSVWPNDTTV